MKELDDESIQLVVTSPPYYNAPHDYKGMYEDYWEYLSIMSYAADEVFRVMESGRIVAVVCDDMLINGKRYPVVADMVNVYRTSGFDLRERITWLKPLGYISKQRRSGVAIQHPFPMYTYLDNRQEQILIFQKGKFDYKNVPKNKEESSLNIKEEWLGERWHINVWEITNVLPNKNGLEHGIAAFPEEIPYRLIKMYSYKGETVLDPFLGSGTTMKVAHELGRKCYGYEIDESLRPIILQKVFGETKRGKNK